MIDIHCHLLPGLDDGAQTLAHALAMADLAVSSGVSAICLTPHTNLPGLYHNYECPQMENQYLDLQTALRKERIPLKLFRGAEIFSTHDLADLLKNRRVATMNHTRFCLIEFNFTEKPQYITTTIQDCIQAGYRPILAHPERYYEIQDDPRLLYQWIRLGALTQINKGSILGEFGPECEKCADHLLDHGLATCIASDAHDLYNRTPDMSEIARYLRRQYGLDRTHQLLHENPRKMILSGRG